jgi:hypothetical protein
MQELNKKKENWLEVGGYMRDGLELKGNRTLKCRLDLP